MFATVECIYLSQVLEPNSNVMSEANGERDALRILSRIDPAAGLIGLVLLGGVRAGLDIHLGAFKDARCP